ncbi:MAG TPA: hypothetical protein DDY43_01605 [Synechococcales bacterium UBA10510]|nr:hypothetical protein [Synechococcales bacterium UBA10510]
MRLDVSTANRPGHPEGPDCGPLESTCAAQPQLHLLALLGGWPGGLIARHKLRHKTIKQPFRFIFWCTVVLNCLGLGFTSLSFFQGPG